MDTVTEQFTRWTHRFVFWPQKRLLRELVNLYEGRLLDMLYPASYYDTLPDKLDKLNVPHDVRTRVLAFVTDQNGPFQQNIQDLLKRVRDYSNTYLPEAPTADVLEGVCKQLKSIGTQIETLNCNLDRYLSGPTLYGGPSQAELNSGKCQRAQSVSLGSVAGKDMLTPEHSYFLKRKNALMKRIRADERLAALMPAQ